MAATPASAPTPASTLQQAAALANKGLHVFRLKRGTKDVPLDTDWATTGATVDPFELHEKFSAGEYNIGVRATGLVILDIDVKGNINGFESLKALGLKLPQTYAVRTPSGGLHLYFDASGERYGQRDLAPGVNIRATNGYVVAPGSVVGDRPYQVEHDAPIARLPSTVATMLKIAAVRDTSASEIIGDLDTPCALAAATDYLENVAPPAVWGAGGNPTTYAVACKVMNYGVSTEKTFELMAEHWDSRCSPPWLPEWADDLERVVNNAAQYKQSASGRDNPAGGFTAVELAPRPPEPSIPIRPQLFEPSAARWMGKEPEPAPFTVERIVPQGYVTAIGAAGGRGKSAFGLQIMVCIAAGLPFLGYKVESGAAAGIFCEDADADLHRRTKDICRKLDIPFDAIADRLSPTSFLQADATLWRERDGPTEFMAEIERAAAGRPDLKLLVVDGAADTFAASEN